MPRQVDHDSRRAELASAVWTIVAKQGVETVTIRDVARESGWSTGVVSHYFRNKDDLMQFAFRLSMDQSVERMLQQSMGAEPLEAIRIVLLESLSVTDEQRLESILWGVIIGKAFTNPAISDEVRSLYERWAERIASLIRQGQSDGSIRQDIDPGEWSRLSIATVDGFVIQSFFLPGGDSYLGEHVRILSEQVDGLATSPKAP